MSPGVIHRKEKETTREVVYQKGKGPKGQKRSLGGGKKERVAQWKKKPFWGNAGAPGGTAKMGGEKKKKNLKEGTDAAQRGRRGEKKIREKKRTTLFACREGDC